MENIEDNLLKYRVRKRRQERFERFREKAWSFLMLGVRGGSNPEDDNAPRTDITLNVNFKHLVDVYFNS